jgi:hypothetical protein
MNPIEVKDSLARGKKNRIIFGSMEPAKRKTRKAPTT